MKRIYILCLLCCSIVALGQTKPIDLTQYLDSTQRKQMQQRKPSAKPKPGPLFNEFRLKPGEEIKSESVGMQAIQDGYGSSKWDKNIEYYPGKDLKKSRELAKQQHQEELVSILVPSILGTILLIFLIWQLVKKLQSKKKDNQYYTTTTLD